MCACARVPAREFATSRQSSFLKIARFYILKNILYNFDYIYEILRMYFSGDPVRLDRSSDSLTLFVLSLPACMCCLEDAGWDDKDAAMRRGLFEGYLICACCMFVWMDGWMDGWMDECTV
jgi:hypothetical protein